MHLTLVEIYPAMSAAAVAWLMIRMSQANGLARLRTPPRCAACRRRLTKAGGCSCMRR
jgi:hypothetical protein